MKIDYQSEREELNRLSELHFREYLQITRGISPNTRMVSCIFHADRTPSCRLYEGNGFCFGCGKAFRLIDLIALDNGLTVHDRQAWDMLRQYVGYDGTRTAAPAAAKPKPAEREPVKQLPEQDLTQYIVECAAKMGDTDYMQRRGISREICERFMIGFDAEFYCGHNTVEPRIIFPYSRFCGKARRTFAKLDENGKDRDKALAFPKGASQLLYDPAGAMAENQPLFVCEGEIDALTVIQAGGNAIALSGTGNVKLFLDVAARLFKRRTAPVILFCDADEAGQAADKALFDGLHGLQNAGIISRFDVRIIGADEFQGVKDANDLLTQKPEQLGQIMRAAFEKPIERLCRLANIKIYILSTGGRKNA